MPNTIRVKAEAKTEPGTGIKDANTSKIPFWWRGDDLRIELALTQNGTHLLAASVGTIDVAVKAQGASESDANLMFAEIEAADCDSTFTGDKHWDAGTKQLCVATFTDTESALAAGRYWLIISHEDGSGDIVRYGRIEVEVHDSLHGGSVPEPAAATVDYVRDKSFADLPTIQALTGSSERQLIKDEETGLYYVRDTGDAGADALLVQTVKLAEMEDHLTVFENTANPIQVTDGTDGNQNLWPLPGDLRPIHGHAGRVLHLGE